MKKKCVLKLLVAALVTSMALEPCAIVYATDIAETKQETNKDSNSDVISLERASDDSGTIGSLSWSYTESTKTLSITGTGSMGEMAGPTLLPWYDLREDIDVIEVGTGVSSLCDYAFYMCSNVSIVNLPATLTIIGNKAFDGCAGLTSITIPAMVSSIGEEVFWGCSKLTEISANGSHFKSDNSGVLYSADGKVLYTYPAGKTAAEYKIADGTEEIKPYAFYDAKALSDIDIPDSVKKIGYCAFEETAWLSAQRNAADDNVVSVNGIVIDGKTATGDVILGEDITGIAPGAFDKGDGSESDINSITIKNPECEIGANGDDFTTIPGDIKINAPAGSLAEDYAKTSGNEFSSEGQSVYVKELSIDVPTPAAGDKASSLNNVSVEGFSTTAVTITPDDDVFKENTQYTAVITLTPNQDTTLASTVIARVNGDNATAESIDGKLNITYSFAQTAPSAENAAYTVNHLLQDTNLSTYSKREEESLSARKGSVVNGVAKTYTGFTAKDISSATVAGDGTTVLEVKYDRNTYEINYVTQGGTHSNETSYTYGVKTIELTEATLSGYTFDGWYSSYDSNTDTYADKVIAITTEDAGEKTLYAKYTKNETGTTTPDKPSSDKPSTDKPSSGGSSAANKPSAGTSNTDKYASYTVGNYIYQISDANAKTVILTGVYKAVGKEITIPDTVNINNVTYKVIEIGNSAFKDQSNLEKVTISGNIVTIGKRAFYNCKNLKKVVIGTSVKLIDDYAFYKAVRLSTVTVGKNVETIGDYAFYNCKKLKKITLSGKVSIIGTKAFMKCSSLKKVTLGKNITVINANAFRDCTALTKITIPKNVSKIGSRAFYNCKKLKTVTFKSKKMTSIGSKAFKKCKKGIIFKVPKTKIKAYKILLDGTY